MKEKRSLYNVWRRKKLKLWLNQNSLPIQISFIQLPLLLRWATKDTIAIKVSAGIGLLLKETLVVIQTLMVNIHSSEMAYWRMERRLHSHNAGKIMKQVSVQLEYPTIQSKGILLSLDGGMMLILLLRVYFAFSHIVWRGNLSHPPTP